jgi:hypothetical protein
MPCIIVDRSLCAVSRLPQILRVRSGCTAYVPFTLILETAFMNIFGCFFEPGGHRYSCGDEEKDKETPLLFLDSSLCPTQQLS